MNGVGVPLACVVIFLFIASPCPALEWARTYGHTGPEIPSCILQNTEGGYTVAGITNSFGINGYGLWVLKLNTDGTIATDKAYDVTLTTSVYDFQQTTDGGYILSGEVYICGGTEDNLLITKFNPDLSIAWQYSYGGNYGDEAAHAVQQTSDGGYILAGVTETDGAGEDDGWILKLNSTGTATWQKTYGGSFGDGLGSIEPTPDGGYIAAGSTESMGSGEYDAWVIKLNSDGTVDWQKTYGGSDSDSAQHIHQTSDGGYIVAGKTESFGVGVYNIWVVKLYPDDQPNPGDRGVVEWQKVYGGTKRNYLYSFEETTDGGYVAAGYTDSFTVETYDYDFFIMKLDSNGTISWQKTYGGGDQDFGRSAQQTSDGGYVLTGSTYSFGAGGYGTDICVLKLDGNGEIPGCGAMATNEFTVSDTFVAGIDGSTTVSDTSDERSSRSYTAKDTWPETYDPCTAEAPTSDFTADVTDGPVPLIVQFTDQSTGIIDTWEWDFNNDGTIDSYDQNPAPWTYTEAGDYTVSLTATGPGGSDTETKVNYIHIIPQTLCECELVPDATIIPRGGTLGFDITVTNNTNEVQVFGFATYATKPNGGKYPSSGYLIGPVRVSLNPYGSKSAHRSLPIPGNTPLGTYTYYGVVGTPGAGLYDKCQFEFQVIEP